MGNLTTLLNQYQKPLITTATMVLIIIMAISLANAVLFFVERVDQSGTAQTAPLSQRAQPAQSIDTSRIRELFGAFRAETAAVQQDVPETNLNLELQGIFTADDADASTAIVAQRGQSGQLYRIGDRLPGNATLEAVNPDHILIKRGARTEKLAFDDPSIGQGFSRQVDTASLGNNVVLAPNPSPAATALERITQRQQEISKERGITQSQPAQDLRSAITNFQSRLSENPETVLKELGVSSSGSGYKIGGEVSASMLQQAGLRQGDVIVSVNGQAASSVANDKAMVSQIMQSDRARVEVQRGERRFVVTVPIPK